jgi:uncharacterized protein (TIGR02466 family)
MSDNMSLLFGSPLWTFEMPEYAVVNEQLTNAIMAEAGVDPGVCYSNRGGWQSHGKLHRNPEFRVLTDFIASRLDRVGMEYGFGQASSKLRVTSMWANINESGNWNILHSHQSPSGMPNPLVLSGCYYVRSPGNSGDFVLEDFGRPMRYLQLPFQEANLFNSYTVKVPPREGNLLLFPAWMEHHVEESRSNEVRISIAFNVALITNPLRGNQPADRTGS